MENKPIERGGIVVREVNSEIFIFLDNNRSTRLDALREASKILQRETIREETKLRRNDRLDYQDDHNDGFRHDAV
jgi:hypothetical protein